MSGNLYLEDRGLKIEKVVYPNKNYESLSENQRHNLVHKNLLKLRKQEEKFYERFKSKKNSS